MGKGRIWMDPNEATEIGLAKSRRSIKKLCKDNYIVKRQTVTHSRSKARAWDAAKRLGRHMGIGKRQGCKNARMPMKLFWIRRQRALRRLLKKLRKNKKVDKNLYKSFIWVPRVTFTKIKRSWSNLSIRREMKRLDKKRLTRSKNKEE